MVAMLAMDAIVGELVLELEHVYTRSGIKLENGGWVRLRDLLRLRHFHGSEENALWTLASSSAHELQLSVWDRSRWVRLRGRSQAPPSEGASEFAQEIMFELEKPYTRSGIMFDNGGWVSLRDLLRLRQFHGAKEADLWTLASSAHELQLAEWGRSRWIRLQWAKSPTSVAKPEIASSLVCAKELAIDVNSCATSSAHSTKVLPARLQHRPCFLRWRRMIVGSTACNYTYFIEQATFCSWRRFKLAKRRSMLLREKINGLLLCAGFQSCGEKSMSHLEKGITIEFNEEDFEVPVEIVVDGIDAEDLHDWAELQINEDIDNFAIRLIEWATAQRSSHSGFVPSDDLEDAIDNGLEKLQESRLIVMEEVAKRLQIPVSTLATRLKARKPLLIRSWGRECSKSAPAGSEANFNACVLNAKGGEADASRMNGTYEEMQRKVIKGPLFLGWMVRAVVSIESSTAAHPFGLHNISINCAHGRHRSVSAAEVLRKWFYPQAEHVLQEKQRVNNAKGWSGKPLR